METFGAPLPVLVCELLTSVESLDDVSVQLSDAGWAWLVSGRRLLVWRFQQAGGGDVLCRELTLPPSDLAHHARLVLVLSAARQQRVPGCVAVTPEGTVCYWPSVLQSGLSSQLNAELQGQECERLVSLDSNRCLLATTTSTLVLLECGHDRRLLCRRISASSGLLGGIGRRVSSMFWSSMQTSGIEEPLVSLSVAPRQAPESGDTTARSVFLLSSKYLQKWLVDADNGDSMLYQVDIARMAADKFQQMVWSDLDSGGERLLVTPCDVQVRERGCVLLLLAAAHPACPQHQHLALARLEDCGLAAPQDWLGFTVLRLPAAVRLQPDRERLCLLAVAGLVRIHSRRQIVCVLEGDKECQALALSSPRDHILGSGFGPDGVLLLCSSNQGLISADRRTRLSLDATNVSLSVMDADTAASSRLHQLDVSLIDSDSQSLLADHSDLKSQLRNASILFCRGELAQSSALVHKLFPLEESVSPDCCLDLMAVALSRDIIDDFPANDPRWAEVLADQQTQSCGSGSVILQHQLEDKRCAHQLYVAFLKSTGLWRRLTGVTLLDGLVNTGDVIAQHHEQVVAAQELAALSGPLMGLLERAVVRLVSMRGEDPVPPLTHRDLFFRYISSVDDVLCALVDEEQSLMEAGCPARQVVQTIIETNSILLTVLWSVWRCRDLSQHPLSSTHAEHDERVDRLAWLGSSWVRELLRRQHSLTLKQGVQLAEQQSVRVSLYQQLTELSDLTLSVFKLQLDLLNGNVRSESLLVEYEAERYQLILPLLEAEQYERAASLAEKYHDFRILIEVCDRTGNLERRQKYLSQFANKGFASFVFNWYLERGQRGKLMGQCETAELLEHVERHAALRWLGELKRGQFNRAADTLQDCSSHEIQSLSRKKTLLSLSKLCRLSAGCHPEVVDEQLQLVELQEAAAGGRLQDDQRVLTPRELILLQTAPQNQQAGEMEFVRSLELCRLVPNDDQRRDTWLTVWCRALLRDGWRPGPADTNRPLDTCARMFLFRVAEAARSAGLESSQLLPDVDELLACQQLQHVAQDSTVRFLLQAGYEQLLRS